MILHNIVVVLSYRLHNIVVIAQLYIWIKGRKTDDTDDRLHTIARKSYIGTTSAGSVDFSSSGYSCSRRQELSSLDVLAKFFLVLCVWQ